MLRAYRKATNTQKYYELYQMSHVQTPGTGPHVDSDVLWGLL